MQDREVCSGVGYTGNPSSFTSCFFPKEKRVEGIATETGENVHFGAYQV